MANRHRGGPGTATGSSATGKLGTPWWFLPTFSVLLALPALGLGLGPPQGVPLYVAGLCGSLILMASAQRRAVVQSASTVRGPHDRWLWGLLGGLVVLYGAELLINFTGAPTWLIWVPAALVVPLTIGLGRGFERGLRQTLAAGRRG